MNGEILLESKEARTQRRPRFLSSGWTLEVMAITASIGCMIAIVAILLKMKDRPLAWWKFFLSLPATVAIFATAAKTMAGFAVAACLGQYKWMYFRTNQRTLSDFDLIEEAARGPLGSWILLVTRPKAFVAGIGAVTVILALAVDVFYQQAIEFNPIDVQIDDGNATFGLAHNYFSTAISSIAAGNVLMIEASTPDTSMQGAIYKGLFDTVAPSAFKCTSNCIWNSSYISLGFASTCSDVTASTLQKYNATKLWSGLEAGGRGSNITTSGGVPLRATYSATSFQTVISVGGISLQQVAIANKDLTVSEAIEAGVGVTFSPKIARIAVFRVPSDLQNFVIKANEIQITECDISLTAYRYSDMSGTGSNLTIGSQQPIPLDPGIVLPSILPNSTAAIGRNPVVFNQTGLDTTLTASLQDISALNLLFLSPRFTGNLYDGESPTTDGINQGVGDAFRSGNVSDVVWSMTQSMTDHLRSSFDATAPGLSIRPEVFVQIRWEWLVLPFFVQFLSILFVLLVLLGSRQAWDLPLWKSSMVATMYHGLAFQTSGVDDNVATLGTNVQSVSEMEALAKATKAKLQ
ncbi:hypothetical protein B0T17DRAFT_587800 [Bombardia bombarda]|uniref:Uncharacterized protein n=1 Tax=Bombardia bombarda TaxID=252184 RepID=A0AA40CFV2_9PEZI|nr:hypothetical protein B0T17DRAFT_587800 [Bombardia bombarda]